MRVIDEEHINIREGRAFLALLRWVLRARGRHGHRIVILVDSRVWLGGVTKGRSSSLPLNTLLRQVAALVMAGGLVLHVVFIPTAWNPADDPSRGLALPRARRDYVNSGDEASKAYLRLQKYFEDTDGAWQHLIDSGMTTDPGSDAFSGSSFSSGTPSRRVHFSENLCELRSASSQAGSTSGDDRSN